MKQTNTTFKAPVEHDEKTFTRAALLSLAMRKDVSPKVLENHFDTIELHDEEYLTISTDVEINYTCSVGYDTEVPRTELKKSYDVNAGEYTYRTETSSETVTNWQAFSGNLKDTFANTVKNSSTQKGAVKFEVILSKVKEMQNKIIKIEEPSEINQKALDYAKKEIVERALDSIQLPGDRHKDLSYHENVELTDAYVSIFPFYTLKDTEKSTNIKGFACGKMHITSSYPSSASNIKNIGKQKAKPFNILSIIFLLSTVAMFFVLPQLFFIPPILSIIMFIIGFNKKSKAEQEAVKIMYAQKKEKIKEIFKKKGLSPLTDKEIHNFEFPKI